MDQACYLAPRSEYWVIAAVAKSVAVRLASECADPVRSRSLLRLLFGLQRFPRITPGLVVQISWSDIEAPCSIGLTSEDLTIERAHTRLQYFVGSHHLLDLYDNLSGWERRQYLENWLPLLASFEDPAEKLWISDYSDGQDVDRPPLNDQWQQPMIRIYFDSE